MFFVCQYIDSVLFTNKNAQSALSGKCIHQKKGKNCNLHCHDWEYSWIRCHENGWRKRQAGNETISGFVASIAFQAFESASACEFFLPPWLAFLSISRWHWPREMRKVARARFGEKYISAPNRGWVQSRNFLFWCSWGPPTTKRSGVDPLGPTGAHLELT